MEDILILEAINDSDASSDDDLDDMFILHVLNDEDNLGNRRELYGEFNLNNLFEVECKNLFRFSKDDIPRLTRALGIPDRIVTNERIPVSGITSLCILLRRLAYPNRLVDLEPLFGLSATALSSIIFCVTTIIYTNKGHILQELANATFLDFGRLVQYSEAISQKGSPVPNCWGFIDGTARAICRPSVYQENYYSGHKKFHCLKYQSLICPDGIIINLKGPYEGRRHDAGIFRESGLYAELEQHTVFPNQNQHFVIYGDQAYGLRQLLLRPYTQHEIANNQERQNFNVAMSALRISVEWGFGKVIQEFAFLDFRKNQKLLLQDVSHLYKVGIILTNCHTCLYGGQTSTYFEVNPPELEVYLGENND